MRFKPGNSSAFKLLLGGITTSLHRDPHLTEKKNIRNKKGKVNPLQL